MFIPIGGLLFFQHAVDVLRRSQVAQLAGAGLKHLLDFIDTTEMTVALEEGLDSHHGEFADARSFFKLQGVVEIFGSIELPQQSLQGFTAADRLLPSHVIDQG